MKKYLEQNVYDAAKKRIHFAFSNFEKVLVAFSGGKDSGVMLNLCYEYAKDNNLMHKMAMYYEDYEGGYNYTLEYVRRTFERFSDIQRFWLCLPISAQCSCSMYQNYWIPWDKEKQEIWINTMPNYAYVINEYNCPFEFKKGTYGGELRKQFAKWYSQEYGQTAVMVGIRCDESLARLGTITSQHRAKMYKEKRFTEVCDNSTVNFYPIYDWQTKDVWIANAKKSWDYNKLYDLFYKAGLSISQMRVASPFHICGQDNLKLFKIIEPDTWGRMVSRVNGVNFTGIYGGTTAMGWKKIKKPDHFTWKQYAEFLLKTLPPAARERVKSNVKRIQETWQTEGYGRNPRVIAQMEKEGVILEHTGKIAKNCTKPGVYEIVKMKSEIPDDTSIPLFRKCPNWKGVCITILKNDYTCTYMGCSRTVEDMKKRRKALEKYKNI
jgi:predicted phosphoadenosine phosphosulfate sulfurtransferase